MNNSRNISIEAMIAMLLKGVESNDVDVKKTKSDLSTMSEIVELHSTSIKHLEYLMNKLSVAFNQGRNGTLPSDTMQNLRNDGISLAITTQRCKVLPEHHLIVKLYVHDVTLGNKIQDKDGELKSDPTESEKQKKVCEKKETIGKTPNIRDNDKLIKNKEKGLEMQLAKIPKPLPQFLQRIIKKVVDGKFIKFMAMFKKLSVNVPFVKDLGQMPG